MPTPKLAAGSIIDPLTLSKLGGGEITIGGARENWSLAIVYRGRHCARCKPYLTGLNDMLAQWTDADFDVAVVSADSEEKALDDQQKYGWNFDLGYGLSEAQMAVLGLYVSDPLSEAETDRRFAEPGAFVFRPDGSVLLVAVSNGPSARPDLAQLLDGMIFTRDNDRPPRGMA